MIITSRWLGALVMVRRSKTWYCNRLHLLDDRIGPRRALISRFGKVRRLATLPRCSWEALRDRTICPRDDTQEGYGTPARNQRNIISNVENSDVLNPLPKR